MYTAPPVVQSEKTDEEILDELDSSMKKEDVSTLAKEPVIPTVEVKKEESVTSIATHNHQDKYNITNISIHLNTPSRNATIVNDEEEGDKKTEEDSADIMHTIQ